MNFGIPIPEGASGTFAALERTANPFDAGRIPCPQGGEDRWSARWLMEQMGYSAWQKFEPIIERAKTAAHNEGFNVRTLFTQTVEKGDGRPALDYHVTRFAAYLIAMNGQPSKPEVAAAQTYFAVKTRQAETAPRELTEDEIVAQALAITTRRVEALTARVAELEPPAAAWNELAEAAGDYSVADAAKVLSRDPNINIKERALFAYMAGLEWVFKREGRWKAMRSQLDTGRLAEKVGKPYWHAGREEMVAGDATVRITPKGLAALHKILGGSGQQMLAVAE